MNKVVPSCKVNGTNHTMVCTACDKILGTLVESDQLSSKFNFLCKKEEVLVKYECICLCGGNSFVVKSKNECYFVPLFELSVKDSIIDVKQDYVRYQIILEK